MCECDSVVLAYDFLYIIALYYVALFFSVSMVCFHVYIVHMHAHIYRPTIFDTVYPYIHSLHADKKYTSPQTATTRYEFWDVFILC